MPRSVRWSLPFFLRFMCAVLLGTVVAVAAPRPLPDLKPEELQLRALVEPLRQGLSEGPALQPLHDWLDAREAAGKSREAERELRRVLKRIDDEYQQDLLRAAEWVRTLQIQRTRLYREVSDDKISLPRAIEKSQELAPVPTQDELLLMHGEISDGFLATDGQAIRTGDAFSPRSAGQDLPDTEHADSTDLDATQLLNRLTLDLTALMHLLHECDNEYEQEKKRHRTALEALTKVLQARRTSARALN